MTTAPTGDADGSNLYRTAFRETATATIIADEQFTILDVNEAFVDLCGYGRQEVIGDTALLFIDDPRVFAEATETLAAGERWSGEMEIKTKFDQFVYGHATATPIRSDGSTQGYVASFTDLTTYRQQQQSLKILNRVLRHNLRNDGNVILGMLDLIEDAVTESAVEDEAICEAIQTARGRTDGLLNRADKTRQFSSLMTPDEECTLRPMPLATAVTDAIEQSDVDSSRVAFSDDDGDDGDDGDESEIEVLADDNLVAALAALIENGIEHNDSETPCVEISIERGDDSVVLEIADNGSGVEPQRRNEIFGREENSPVHHGSGLSLFFVDRLMEIYGGSISCLATERYDSVFELEFRSPA